MTITSHDIVMKKDETNVMIAEFKARLSHYLRTVRRGKSITIFDRDTPIAIVLPYSELSQRLVIRKPVKSPKDVQLPIALKRVDSLELLLEERGERLS